MRFFLSWSKSSQSTHSRLSLVIGQVGQPFLQLYAYCHVLYNKCCQFSAKLPQMSTVGEIIYNMVNIFFSEAVCAQGLRAGEDDISVRRDKSNM